MDETNIQSLIKNNLDISRNYKKSQDLNPKMGLEEIAQEFESIFVFQMLKSARSAKLAKDIFGNSGQETYQSLLDQEYAKTLAKGHNFGIAEALVRQFEKHVNGSK